ncbi:unnamed protein product [Allacma fusca]|uniref:Ig-like domain-containing protein n=1 Tax=Allacma fusca TaxID=39272 RepID=A0A8J2P9M3_9HEXA|nr:unnamed protein product [Allacma fusca]
MELSFSKENALDEETRCKYIAGKPEPVVSWYVNGELEDSSYHMDRYGDVINDLLFRGLKRSHLNSQFSCRANNTKLIQPVEKTVVLELNQGRNEEP